jgi:hypothetical protein
MATFSSSSMFFFISSISCGFPPGFEAMISIRSSPLRIFVTDPGSYSKGSCVFLSTKQMTKTMSHQC